MNAFPLAMLLVVLTLTQGCSTSAIYHKDMAGAANTAFDHADTPEQLIARANATNDRYTKATLYLDAATLYWHNNLFAQTSAALQSVEAEFLTHETLQLYLLLNLRLGLAEENTTRLESTLPLLVSNPLYQARIEDQVKFVELIANAYRMTGRHISTAIILAENTGLFSAERQRDAYEAIWIELQNADINELAQAHYNYSGDNYDAQGWLALALTIRQNQISLEKQYAALKSWNDAWPAHPATSQPPRELEILSRLPTSRPNRITLALPLSGPLSEVGTAIRDGFMASYYNANLDANLTPNATRLKPLPFSEDDLTIHFFNTHENNIERLYDDFQSQNALIIGPLDKQSLKKLATYDELNTQTLALNYLEEPGRQINNLFQFGLAPEAETRQIVKRIVQKKLSKIAVIAPESNWGFRIHDAFYSALSAEQGTLIESAFYSDQASLSNTVAKLLATNDSKKRARKVRSISGLKLEFLPRRRQDVDAIFMIAQAETARQLNPLFAFHYAKNIPVFATSQIHSPRSGVREHDLSLIEFVEMPWMLSLANNIKNKLHELIPESSQKYNRFYALGADAFKLAPRLQLLKEIKGSQMEGQTGVLSINEDGTINRDMQWARFKNGNAIAIQD